MNTHIIADQFEQACQLTQQVIQHLEQDDIEPIIALEAKRQQLIKAIFEQDKQPIEKQQIEKLLQLNKAAERLLIIKKRSLVEHQSKMNKGKSAALAYKRHM